MKNRKTKGFIKLLISSIYISILILLCLFKLIQLTISILLNPELHILLVSIAFSFPVLMFYIYMVIMGFLSILHLKYAAKCQTAGKIAIGLMLLGLLTGIICRLITLPFFLSYAANAFFICLYLKGAMDNVEEYQFYRPIPEEELNAQGIYI